MFDRGENHWMRGSPSSHQQSWIRIERLQGGGQLIYSTDMDPTVSERTGLSQDPEKYSTHNPKKIQLLFVLQRWEVWCTTFWQVLPFAHPLPSLTQLPLLILEAFNILLQQGALQSSGFLLLLSSPQNADNHACSQAPRLYQHFSR